MADLAVLINLLVSFFFVLYLKYARGMGYGSASEFITSTFAHDPEDVTPITPLFDEDAAEAVTNDLFEFALNDSAGTHFNSTPVISPRDPLYVVIPITLIYVAIFVCGVVGNVVTFIVIVFHRSMHTSTNYYLISMSISDVILLMSGVPQEVFHIWYRHTYIFGEPFCIIRGIVAETSAHATVLTITAFTVERYLAVCHPFLSFSVVKLSRAFRLIIAIWITALGFAIPSAAQFGVVSLGSPEHTSCAIKRVTILYLYETITVLFFVFPITTISVLYILIGARLRESTNMQRARRNQEAGFDAIVGRHYTSNSSSRVIRTLVYAVLAFSVCWAPYHTRRLVSFYVTKTESSRHFLSAFDYISGILFYLSTNINPILYHIMSDRFRESFKEFTAECCRLYPLRLEFSSATRRFRQRRRRADTSQSGLSRRTTLNRRIRKPTKNRWRQGPDSTGVAIPLQMMNPEISSPLTPSQWRQARGYEAWIKAGRRIETGRSGEGSGRNVSLMIATATSTMVVTATGGYFSVPAELGRIESLTVRKARPEGMITETSFGGTPGTSKDDQIRRLETVMEESEESDD